MEIVAETMMMMKKQKKLKAKQTRQGKFVSDTGSKALFDNVLCKTILTVVCVLEFIYLMHILIRNEEVMDSHINHMVSVAPVVNASSLEVHPDAQMPEVNPREPWSGVAVTLFQGQPTWFQRRYTTMIRNVRNNIPADWGIQIFYASNGQTKSGFDINIGLRRMIENGHVNVTLIPKHLSDKKKKPKEMWTERWLWENVKADRVLVFGGNSVLCGNSPHSVATFAQWDYIGSPWDQFKKVGGDGGLSLRNRAAMLAVIDFELAKLPADERGSAYKKWGQDGEFFVSRMIEMNKLGVGQFKLGSREATLMFSAIGSAANDEVWGASGTLGPLPHEQRERFLAMCPELKTIFPALHDPNCFGASSVLNATLCAASICALQDRSLHRGGC